MDTQRSPTDRFGRLAAASAAALLAMGVLPAPAAAVVPTAGGPVSATNYAIDVGTTVHANDPHVSGDLAAYTADGAVIRYYNFVTAANAAVPSAPGAIDFLSDVSNGRIVFSRVDSSARIMVFDTALTTTSEIDTQPGVFRLAAAIGNDTVAFIDKTTTATGNLHAAFIGSPGSTQVTNDGRITGRPSVAPAGNLIVYESCPSSQSDCSVRQAAWNGTSWVVSNITDDGVEAEANPDTDGAVVVYAADRGGDREIAWQPVGGGAEQVLTMVGTQRFPTVNGGMVAFESVAGDGTADVFLYDIANNRLFQLTSTPGVDETLNDLFLLPSGVVRVVWAEGPAEDRDVRGADLTLPPVGPSYAFGGLLAPVDPLPTLNSMKAGAAVPVKFSLGGDFGLDVFATGYPKSQTVACDSTAPVDGIEQTVTAGGSGLTFDPASGLYTYVWKSDRTWAATCRQLVLWFQDGTVARANFKFK